MFTWILEETEEEVYASPSFTGGRLLTPAGSSVPSGWALTQSRGGPAAGLEQL